MLRGVSVRFRVLSSRGRLGCPMFCFILPDTSVKSVSRQAHSPHKVTPRDAFGLPFPIELPEPRPVDFNGLSACVLALCFGDLDALTLSLFELFSFKLRECSEHGQHEFARRSVRVDILLMADECYPFVGKGVDDVQQVLCRAPQTADTLDVKRIALTHIKVLILYVSRPVNLLMQKQPRRSFILQYALSYISRLRVMHPMQKL